MIIKAPAPLETAIPMMGGAVSGDVREFVGEIH